MIVFRVASRKHLATAMTGFGASLHGGRWNAPGRPMIYTATSRSLAQLEMLVHASRHTAPTDHVLLAIEVPDSLERARLDSSSLPAGWRRYPAPSSLAAFGDRWLETADTVALEVPSAVVPEEWICLLNPSHPAFVQVRELSREDLVYDPRLFG